MTRCTAGFGPPVAVLLLRKALMRALFLSAIVMGTTLLGAEPPVVQSVTKPKATVAKKSLDTPSYLNPLARQLLKTRMLRHSNDALALVHAVVLLDHRTAQRLATELASEPRLTRAIAGGEDDLNAALPERFFVLQDELRSRALELAEAAKKSDSVQMSERLGELTKSCVACHAAYLEPRPRNEP